jgi:hypothetical protein
LVVNKGVCFSIAANLQTAIRQSPEEVLQLEIPPIFGSEYPGIKVEDTWLTSPESVKRPSTWSSGKRMTDLEMCRVRTKVLITMKQEHLDENHESPRAMEAFLA